MHARKGHPMLLRRGLCRAGIAWIEGVAFIAMPIGDRPEPENDAAVNKRGNR